MGRPTKEEAAAKKAAAEKELKAQEKLDALINKAASQLNTNPSPISNQSDESDKDSDETDLNVNNESSIVSGNTEVIEKMKIEPSVSNEIEEADKDSDETKAPKTEPAYSVFDHIVKVNGKFYDAGEKVPL